MTGVFSFVKVILATILRDEGQKALVWCGASQQLGSFLGAIVIFFLINFGNIFQSAPVCPV